MSGRGDGAAPASVYEALGRMLADDRGVAWAELDDAGRVRDCGGALDTLGLGALARRGAHAAEVAELTGLLPLDGDRLHLPMLRIAGAARADLFIVRRDGGHVLVALPCTGSVAELAGQQQRLNEAALQGQVYARLLDRFVGGELVRQRLLDAPLAGAIEPATRELTVLFADVRGFTPFCEAREAAEVCASLNGFLGAMIDAVTAHGGLVDKVIGDAVMAIFGLAECETDTRAAAKAALDAGHAMVASVRAFLADKAGWGVEGVGVGIATGPVAIGVLGTSERRAFTAIGHRVNLAARLESGAAPGEILVDEATWRAIGERGRPFRADRRRLKGVRDPVPVYSVF